jgi:translation elongation factor EF-Ts
VCETDFVARGASMAALAERCAARYDRQAVVHHSLPLTFIAALISALKLLIEAERPISQPELLQRLAELHGDQLQDLRRATGEAVSVRRVGSVSGPHAAFYLHRPSGITRVAALVATTHPSAEFNEKAAIHVASMGYCCAPPLCV